MKKAEQSKAATTRLDYDTRLDDTLRASRTKLEMVQSSYSNFHVPKA